MSGDKGVPRVDSVLDILAMLWNPGVEAMRVQKEMNVRSLEKTIAAAQRAGCDVCYAELPDNVSGFATVIAGKPHIVLNRAKPRHHMHYTVSHELGHHVLEHLSPSTYSSALTTEALQEYQAHMFATTLVWFTPDRNKDMEAMLKQNPESIVMYLAIFGSLGAILFAVLAHVASLLFTNPPAKPETNR